MLAPIAIGMSLNKFFPKVVKSILPFAPVVGVVSTCLLVASAIAQVANPILNAGISLQVSRSFLFVNTIVTHLFLALTLLSLDIDPCFAPSFIGRHCRICLASLHWF